MNVNAIIAMNLKRLRTERHLSLGQLADLCGLSKVMLSQIEKGEANPTINTLWKIANGLKVPYTLLLDEQKSEVNVLSKKEIPLQSVDCNHYRVFCFYPNTPTRNFELFQIELDSGFTYTSIGHSAKSKEYIMVLEGTLELTTSQGIFTLSKDDAIEFDAAPQHTYNNVGETLLKAAVINFYPI